MSRRYLEEIENGDKDEFALIGAGAVGCYFVAGLKEKLGGRIWWVITEGERKGTAGARRTVDQRTTVFPCVKAPEEGSGEQI